MKPRMVESVDADPRFGDRERSQAVAGAAEPTEIADVESRLDRAIRALEATSGPLSTDTRLAAVDPDVRELAEIARLAVAIGRRTDEARVRAEAASQAKDEFLGLLSHELRTPVGGVLIWTQLLRTAGDDHAAATKAADMIERSTRALIQLVNDLLDASRIVAGKLTVEVRPLDFMAVVSAAVEAVVPVADAKGVRLERIMDPGPVEVAGDPVRLQQVVGNLLSNAVKFTPHGARVEVGLESSAGEVWVRVKDEGTGIEPAVLAQLLDARPRQVGGDRGGLGLGLLIARHLVELHHGSLEAESQGPGTGTAFTVKLPRLGLGTARGPGARLESLPPDSVDGLHVLLVDDEEGARAALGAVLELRGAQVIAVSSCREALAHLDEQRPDVLLSDIAMPIEDGYDLIRQVRQREGNAPPLPAVAVTAYAAAEYRQKALLAGFQEHIPKPVDPDHLIRVLARVTAGLAPRPTLPTDSRR